MYQIWMQGNGTVEFRMGECQTVLFYQSLTLFMIFFFFALKSALQSSSVLYCKLHIGDEFFPKKLKNNYFFKLNWDNCLPVFFFCLNSQTFQRVNLSNKSILTVGTIFTLEILAAVYFRYLNYPSLRGIVRSVTPHHYKTRFQCKLAPLPVPK